MTKFKMAGIRHVGLDFLKPSFGSTQAAVTAPNLDGKRGHDMKLQKFGSKYDLRRPIG